MTDTGHNQISCGIGMRRHEAALGRVITARGGKVGRRSPVWMTDGKGSQASPIQGVLSVLFMSVSGSDLQDRILSPQSALPEGGELLLASHISRADFCSQGSQLKVEGRRGVHLSRSSF
jgi:hypothetical protein